MAIDESQGGIFTGERLVADDALFSADLARHLAAYQFAGELVRGLRVLDAGCGDGYGSHLLAQSAATTLGIDRSEDTIAVARQRYHRPNLHYRACDLAELASLGEQFDVVCHFQVIEHLHDPRPFLRQAREVLAPGGRLVITTPNRRFSLVENPYHVHEYLADELRSVLTEVFPYVEMKGVQASERVMQLERLRGEQANRILRLDPLGIRNHIPRPLVEWAYPRLARFVRRRMAASDSAATQITPADFHVSDSAAESIDLLAVCRTAA